MWIINWNHAGCVDMGKKRTSNERLFDERTSKFAPHLFGWPELTLPTSVVWPPGLHEAALGNCSKGRPR